MSINAEIAARLNTPRTRSRLALALGCTEQTIIRYIKDCSDNLTKAAALMVIREETGLSDEEILSVEIEPKPQS